MIKHLLRWVFPLIIILVSASLSIYWMQNKPRAERKKPEHISPIVKVLRPEFKPHTISVYAMGTVVAAKIVNLTSRINGMVIATSKNFIEGGFLKKGEEIVRLDPTDYKIQIALRESEYQKAKARLALEMGQQKVVAEEVKALGEKLTQQELDLVLRKPYLQIAKAELASAEANLKQARLDLERTHTIAPFNSVILSRNANIGSWISTFSTGTPLVKLVGIDNFWIDVSIPVDKLRWIDIPYLNAKEGSEVRVSYKTGWGEGVYRLGYIKRLKAEVESEGRMAKLIVEVNDPLSQKPENKDAPPLTLGTFVRLQIKGETLPQVAELPEWALRSGKYLWLLTPENTLQIQEVEPVWVEQGNIYLPPEQIPENTQVIISDLSAPVIGMSLKMENANAKEN